MISVKDRLYWKAGEQRVPLSGAFEISPICNFQCKMCYVRKSPRECTDMGGIKSCDWWLNILRQARDKGLLYPLFTGGEPFIYPDFKKLYLETVKMGMQVSINTNASQITEKEITWLREAPPVRMNITLYGADNEAYERLCGEKFAFDRVKKAIDLLDKNQIRFKFNASITPQNQSEIRKIIEFGKKYDRKVDVANYMFPPVRRLEDSFGKNERVSARQCGYNQVLTDWYELTEEEFRNKSKAYQNFRSVDVENLIADSMEAGAEMHCRAGRSSFWVDWQGNLSMCGMIAKPAFMLEKGNFNEKWAEVVEYVNKVRYSPVCRKCPNRKLCHPCISMAYNESGSILGVPEYMCKFTEYTALYFKEFVEMMEQKKLPFGTEKIEDYYS